MENEIRDLLSKLNTQIDGVEAYLRQLIELAHNEPFLNGEAHDLGTIIRAGSSLAQELEIRYLREHAQKIEDALNNTAFSN